MIHGYPKKHTENPMSFGKKDIRDLPKRCSFGASVGSFVWDDQNGVGRWVSPEN